MNLIRSITKNKKANIIMGGIAILAVVFVFTLPRNSTAADNTYQTETAARGNLSASVGATGTVRAKQSVILVWGTTGIVDTVNVDIGASIRTDELLARLEQSSLPQNIILAQADLVSAQKALDDLLASDTSRAQAAITLRDAQDSYDKAKDYRNSLDDKVTYDVITFQKMNTPNGVMRVPSLKTIKYYPDDEEKAKADEKLALAAAQLDDAQRAYDRLKDGPNAQDVAAAEVRVAAAQATLDMAQINAPFAGVVTEADALPGDKVTSGQIAFRVDDLSHLLIDLEVSEVDINSVAVGQPVVVNFDAVQGKDYQGVVTQVAGAGTTSAGSVDFKVTVEISDPDDLVKPGMTAAVLIQIRSVQDALLVPNRAVRVVSGQRVVYVLKDGTLSAAEVRLGATSDTYSEVVGGDLQEGDQIVLNPPAELAPQPSGNGPMMRIQRQP